MSQSRIAVLLIEDNPGDARLIRELLVDAGGTGFDVDHADRLSTGLARLDEGRIDVVLLDLGLPDSVGLETFACVKAKAPDLPIVVLTGLDDETTGTEAVHEGAQDYLVKGSVDAHLLSRAVRYAIERNAAEKAIERQTKELQRVNRELSVFTYVVAHELQEPLTAMASLVEDLRRHAGGETPEEVVKLAERVRWMQNMVGDMLALSRVETRGQAFSPIDCGGVLDEALDNLAATAEKCGARITREGLSTVNGDASQLVRLFQNLVGNAIKFCDGEPKVHVSCRREDGTWHFCVRDNGIGIAPENAQRIFVIFRRLHDEYAYPGTGIGLAICKKIVQRHGGRIWVESEVGQGAAFHFTLPASAPNQPGQDPD